MKKYNKNIGRSRDRTEKLEYINNLESKKFEEFSKNAKIQYDKYEKEAKKRLVICFCIWLLFVLGFLTTLTILIK